MQIWPGNARRPELSKLLSVPNICATICARFVQPANHLCKICARFVQAANNLCNKPPKTKTCPRQGLQSLFDTFAHQQSLWLWHLEHCVDKLIVDFFWCKALISIHCCIEALQCCTTIGSVTLQKFQDPAYNRPFPWTVVGRKSSKTWSTSS